MAIAMSPIEYIDKNPDMGTLILVAGDGDFIDMVKCMQEIYKVEVYVIAWSNSLSYNMGELADEKLHLDTIFKLISEPRQGA
jgi:uncharacterized LabA/DUF88 family protein